VSYSRNVIISKLKAKISDLAGDLARTATTANAVNTPLVSAAISDVDIDSSYYELDFPTDGTHVSLDGAASVAITADGSTTNTNVIAGLGIIFDGSCAKDDAGTIEVANDWHDALDSAAVETGYSYPLGDDEKLRWTLNRAQKFALETALNKRTASFSLSDEGGSLSLGQVAQRLTERIKKLDDEWAEHGAESQSGLYVAQITRDREIENDRLRGVEE